jgi:hypothetical protein
LKKAPLKYNRSYIINMENAEDEENPEERILPFDPIPVETTAQVRQREIPAPLAPAPHQLSNFLGNGISSTYKGPHIPGSQVDQWGQRSGTRNYGRPPPSKGKGFACDAYNYAKTIVTSRNDYPPSVRAILEKYGDANITGITINRTPLHTVLNAAAKAISPDLPYDKLFHLLRIYGSELVLRLRLLVWLGVFVQVVFLLIVILLYASMWWSCC